MIIRRGRLGIQVSLLKSEMSGFNLMAECGDVLPGSVSGACRARQQPPLCVPGRGAAGVKAAGSAPAANSNRASDGSAGAGPGLRALLGPGAILGWMARRVLAGPEPSLSLSPGPARGARRSWGCERRWGGAARPGPGSAGCKQ